jgi:hypothetical protein
MKKIIMLLALTLLVCAGTYAQDNKSEHFVQDRFAIGFWVDPPLDERAEVRYKEIADAHFTLVISGLNRNQPEKVRQLLALCEKYDLKAIITPPDFNTGNQTDGTVCWGYCLRDEPSAADFPNLREQVAQVSAGCPGKFGYINLFPGYASPSKQLGTENYEEYVQRFVDEVNPEVLSLDHYPIFKPDNDGRDRYCADLEVIRRHALRKGIPFWNFFNAMPYGPHTDPTESQMRWQIYASLAYGAKGVLYFCYYTPAGSEFPKGGALITRDNRRTSKYYAARRLNEQLKHLGPTLMKLTSTNVYRVLPECSPEQVLKGSPILNLARDSVDPPHDYLVGAFTHADGRRAVLFMNYRFAYSAWPTITFDAPLDQVRQVDPWSGNEIPVLDSSPDMPGLQVSLQDGEGKLFLLP